MQLKESRTYQNLKKAYVAECSDDDIAINLEKSLHRGEVEHFLQYNSSHSFAEAGGHQYNGQHESYPLRYDRCVGNANNSHIEREDKPPSK